MFRIIDLVIYCVLVGLCASCVSQEYLVTPAPMDNPNQQDHRVGKPVSNDFKTTLDPADYLYGVMKVSENCKSLDSGKLYVNLSCTYTYSLRTKVLCDRSDEVIIQRSYRNKSVKIHYTGQSILKDPKRFPTNLMTDSRGEIQLLFEPQDSTDMGFEIEIEKIGRFKVGRETVLPSKVCDTGR